MAETETWFICFRASTQRDDGKWFVGYDRNIIICASDILAAVAKVPGYCALKALRMDQIISVHKRSKKTMPEGFVLGRGYGIKFSHGVPGNRRNVSLQILAQDFSAALEVAKTAMAEHANSELHDISDHGEHYA